MAMDWYGRATIRPPPPAAVPTSLSEPEEPVTWKIERPDTELRRKGEGTTTMTTTSPSKPLVGSDVDAYGLTTAQNNRWVDLMCYTAGMPMDARIDLLDAKTFVVGATLVDGFLEGGKEIDASHAQYRRQQAKREIPSDGTRAIAVQVLK